MGEFLELLKLFGPWAGTVIFFIWRDYRREDRMSQRIEQLETEQKAVLIPLVERSATVIAENSVVMSKLEKLLDKV